MPRASLSSTSAQLKFLLRFRACHPVRDIWEAGAGARGPLIRPTGEILVTARSERIYPRTEDRTRWTDRPTDRLGTSVGRSVGPALRGRFLVCLVPVHTADLYRVAVGVPVDAEYGRPTDRQTTWVYLLMQSTADRPTGRPHGCTC
jgi:hypothetical protein